MTHYCVVRADLPHGAQAAQLIHAAGRSSPGNIPEDAFAIALSVPDEPTLRGLARSLSAEGLPVHLIVEADEPRSGQAMAIGIEPMDRRRLQRLLSSLPLLK